MHVLLLDTYNLLFRAFSSVPSAVTDESGRPINAVYGLVAAILRLQRELAPDAMVAAFDDPDTPTFRHALYAGYQAQRGPLGGDRAPEFRRQTEIARTLLPGIEIPALIQPGYEADDIMGTLAVRTASAGGTATIVSTDRDLLQLVRTGVQVLVPGKNSLLVSDAEGVRERLGVAPEGVTTFKALAGDASDNIPGVAGIGAKTASDLVNRYGTLEIIYERLSELPARTAEKLEHGREAAQLFRRITTVVTDLDLPLGVENLPRPSLNDEPTVRGILRAAGVG